MIGAIAGDIIGSPWEGGKCDIGNFSMFGLNCILTDDSICTIAVADALLHQKDLTTTLKQYVRNYPSMGYGGSFINWAQSYNKPAYHSMSNGSAMRVASAGWLGDSLDEVLSLAKQTSVITHNHPDGIKSAQAIALCIYLGRQQLPPEEILKQAQDFIGWEVHSVPHYINEPFGFSTLCIDTVPVALACALRSSNWTESIMNACFCGGDTDTICAMVGAISESIYGVPQYVAKNSIKYLDRKLLLIVEEFYSRIGQEPPWLKPTDELNVLNDIAKFNKFRDEVHMHSLFSRLKNKLFSSILK